MNELDELQGILDELHKRLNLISTAQSNQTALREIKEYFLTIQNYLETINTNYLNHIEECTNHTTDIEDLKNQIDEINFKLNNMPSLDDIDFSSINDQISAIQSQIDIISTKLNDLTNDSTYTIKMLENEISSIQDELSTISLNIDEYTTRLDQIDSTLGTHQNSIQNLTTTQSNLTSTTNNLSTTVTSLGTRLTKAENNINSLTGGVDLTEYNERLEQLEEIPPTYRVVDSIRKKLGQTLYKPSQYKAFYTAFHANGNKQALIRIKLKFSMSTGSNLIIKAMINSKNIYKYEIVGTATECECLVPYDYFSGVMQMHFIISCSNTSITFTDLEIDVFCKNALLLDYHPEYEVVCFNNQIYLTRKTDTEFQFGKFTIDNLSLTDFPYNMPLNNQEFQPVYLTFMPMQTGTGTTIEGVTDTVLLHDTKGDIRLYTGYENGQDNVVHYRTFTNITDSYNTASPKGKKMRFLNLRGDIPSFTERGSSKALTFEYLSNVKPGNWTFVADILDNNLNLESEYIADNDVQCLSLFEDDYFYFFPQKKVKYLVKLCRGTYATAFKQLDGSINAYIKNGKKTNVYKIAINPNTNKYEATFLKQTGNSKMFELYDGKYLVEYNNKGWDIIDFTV